MYQKRVDAYLLLLICLMAVYAVGVFNVSDTNAPVDLIASSQAWKKSFDEEVIIHNEARSDVVDVMIPNLKSTKEGLFHKDWSWRQFFNSGLQFKLIFKPDVLLSLVGSDSLGFYLKTLFRLGVSGIGMLFFLRLFFSSRVALLFGGVTFMLNGFNAGWIYWPHVGVVMWFPWLLWASYRLYYSNRPIHHSLLLCIFSTFAIYAWFPSVAAYVFYALGVWWSLLVLFDSKRKKKFSKSAFFGGSICLSLMISAILIYGQKLTLFDTYNVVKERSNLGGSALEWSDLLRLFNPNAFGEPFPELSLFVGRIAIILIIVVLPFRIMGIWRDSKNRLLVSFSLIILTISFLIGWEMINKDLIKLIPTLSFNPWHRITILFCFSLTILASITLDSVPLERYKTINRYTLQFILLSLLLFQFVDLHKHYREYNGVNSTEYWYPETPSIKYIQEGIGQNQKVMADNSYFVPGTLRYFGIRDWFDHGRKTSLFRDYLSKLVRDPHATSTAASYTFDDVTDLSSPFFDIMCIKYITSAYTKDVLVNYPEYWQGESIAINLKNERNASLTFTPDREMKVKSIGAILGTFAEDYLVDEEFVATINTEEWEQSYNFTHTIYNNDTHIFALEEELILDQGVSYRLTLSYLGNNDLAIWAKDRLSPKLAFNVEKDVSKSGWEKVNQEKDVILLENKDVPNGIYFVDDINKIDTDIDFEGLSLTKRGDNSYSFKVRYPLDKPRWVVLAIKDQAHYSLLENLQSESDLKRYMGIFPAFLIKEPGEYNLEYRPPFKWIFWTISLTGLILLVCLAIIRKRIDIWLVSKTQVVEQ